MCESSYFPKVAANTSPIPNTFLPMRQWQRPRVLPFNLGGLLTSGKGFSRLRHKGQH